MDSQAFREFRAKAGGRWAISWQAYVLSVPISMLAIYGALAPLANDTEDLFIAGSLAIGTCLIIGLQLLMLHKTFYRNRSVQPVPLWLIGVTGLLAGTSFSVGIAFGKHILGGDFFGDLWGQIMANSVLIAWWGVTITLLLEDRERFSRQRDAVIENAIELESVKLRGSATEQRLRTALNKKISNEISEARSALNAALKTAALEPGETKWQPVSQIMRSIATDVMRPLSRKLWSSAAVLFPKPSFIKVLQTIINTQPLRPVALTVIVMFLSTSTLVIAFGQLIGITVLVATIGFLWVVMPLATVAMKRWPKQRALFFWLTVFSFQVFDTLIWVWAGLQSGVVVEASTLVVNILACLILILLTSGFGAYGSANQQSLASFRQDLDKKQLSVLVNNRVVSALALEASRNLHGRVQTRLLSCAAAIDRASQTGDIDLLNSALVEVNEIFDAAALSQRDEPELSLGQQLATISKHWDGLCQTKLTIDKGLESLAEKLASDVAAVVEEALTNAVRHGQATRVDIDVEDLGESIGVSVRDNGNGPLAGAPGLGTELIRLISGGNFSLNANANANANASAGGGAELKVYVPKAG